MANDLLAQAQHVRDTADLLIASADKIQRRRRVDFEHDRITPEDVKASVLQEQDIRVTATDLLVQSNDYVLAASAFAQADLQKAIEDANAKIDHLKRFDQVVTVVAALATMAQAIATAKPAGVVKALGDLRDAARA